MFVRMMVGYLEELPYSYRPHNEQFHHFYYAMRD